jgi:hypothetical protein
MVVAVVLPKALAVVDSQPSRGSNRREQDSDY